MHLSGRVCCDSRAVRSGDVFVAVPGVHVDGHDFIAQAVTRGAALIVAERKVQSPDGGRMLLVRNSACALGKLAQAAQGQPASRMTTLAVTGTNGKTTVAYLARAMLQLDGLRCGMVGTIEYNVGESDGQQAANTTPDALRLAALMRQMQSNNLKAVVMECSSHGLDQHRTAGIDFDAAAFTNLSGDHLDYHGSKAAYLAAKGKLFAGLDESAIAVLNGEDPASKPMAQLTPGRVWRFGLDGEYDISAQVKSSNFSGSSFDMMVLGEKVSVRSGLIGLHNVRNCLAAAGLARAVGVKPAVIAGALESFEGLPGRLEQIECGQDFVVLVDYAHTDDALRHVLQTVQRLADGRVLVVFGCGGERDRSKRPRMAAVAEELAERIVLTNDNPRNEDPQEILHQIKAGFADASCGKVAVRPDRGEAISLALSEAEAGDVVLIAGKGHEDYQDIGGCRLPFDDRQVARQALVRRRKGWRPSRKVTLSTAGPGQGG